MRGLDGITDSMDMGLGRLRAVTVTDEVIRVSEAELLGSDHTTDK